MAKRDVYESKCEELITPIIEENNFELVDVEYVKEGSNYYLRVYIDKPGGITVDDCEIVSRSFNEILDKEEEERKIEEEKRKQEEERKKREAADKNFGRHRKKNLNA